MPLLSPWITLSEMAYVVVDASELSPLSDKGDQTFTVASTEALRKLLLDHDVEVSGYYISDLRTQQFNSDEERSNIPKSYIRNGKIDIKSGIIFSDKNYTNDLSNYNYSLYTDVVAERHAFFKKYFKAIGSVKVGRPTIHNWKYINEVARSLAQNGVFGWNQFCRQLQTKLSNENVEPPHLGTLKKNPEIKAIYAAAKTGGA